MQAGATLEEIVKTGATYDRCITSQAEHSSSPDTPMTKGRLRSPLDPIDQPYADWMHTIGVADGPRAGACLPLPTQPHRRWLSCHPLVRLPVVLDCCDAVLFVVS